MTLRLRVDGEVAMEALGCALAEACRPGCVIHLHGELGSGKTTLARGFLRALGHEGPVKSPTYTLVEPYLLQAHAVYHFDLYRLADPQELEYLGVRDIDAERATCLVEWPRRGEGHLPAPDVVVEIEYAEPGRRVEIRAPQEVGRQLRERLAGGAGTIFAPGP